MKTFRTDPDRFGIRARLLTLLLPAIVGLLALDSWNDHRALSKLVQDAYDHSLLESVNLLQAGLSVAPDGSLRMAAPVVSPKIANGTAEREKYLHVGLTPKFKDASDATAPQPELTLLGEPDLPKPPMPTPYATQSTSPVRYDSYFQGEPVRLAALQRTVVDGQGRAFDLLIQVAESTGPRDRAQAASSEQALLRDVRMVLVVIFLVWLGVTWSLHPLEKLRKSVLQSEGHELKPLDTSGVPHEVFPLVDAVNQHVASYRELLDQQSQFLADASHQLRTPLAIMMTQAGVALREKDTGQIQESLRAMVVQIQRSRRLCEQLLSLAHANDSSPPTDTPGVVDLNDIAKDVVLQCLALAHEKNQDLGWTDASGPLAPHAGAVVPVLARGPELHEALTNLVHNAIVYTPAGGSITVMATVRGDQALAEVHDDGPGIAPARRAAVFERFHHTGESPGAPGTGQRGAGLGLSIARAYARRNGGDIELADLPENKTGTRPASGLRAVIRLPLASASPA